MSFLKSHYKELVIGLLAVLVVGLTTGLIVSKKQNKYFEQNLKALVDSVQVVSMQNGQLLFEKQSLILEKEELEKYLDISKKEFKEMESTLNSKISYISKMKSNVVYDTIVCVDTVYKTPDDEIVVDFKYKDEWTNLNGTTKINDYVYSSTKINSLKMNVPLTFGLTEDKKVFITSDNPHVKFTDINGAALSRFTKQKRWGMGPTLTIGAGYGYATNFKNNNVNGGLIVGAMIGWSVHYDVFQW